MRVHSDGNAVQMNRELNAQAFAHKQDIYFSAGKSPGNDALTAHELTHVVQQSSIAAKNRDTLVERYPIHFISSLPPTLQRFSGFEHEGIGDSTHATIDLGNGVVLSWGQVVAIAGDEYASVDELREDVATEPGKARLRGRLEHDMVRGPIPSSLPAETSHSNARYIELAMSNISHFAAGGTAIETWRSHHEHALVAATMSGVDDDAAQWQQAQLTEAFGQHFLTDSFSAGHVRTPRSEIVTWYQNNFAPRALGPFLVQARNRLIQALTDDIGRQTIVPNDLIRAALDEPISVVLLLLNGIIRERFQSLFGLGISGAISGTLHDIDNEQGVWVNSAAHPEPWLAYGDSRLKCSPVSRDQAELAVLTAREQLVQVQALGRTRRAHRGNQPPTTGRSIPGAVPGVVHFAFDSIELDVPTQSALGQAAAYLTAHPEQVLHIIGHTCPLGGDNYNYQLGMRRAEAIASWLMNHGIEPSRVSIASAGKQQIIDASVAGYPSNRRTELTFSAQGDEPPDLVWAQQTIANQIGIPPYQTVERYIPHEVAGRNTPQEDWHWGNLTSAMTAEVDRWVAHYIGDARSGILDNPALNDRLIPSLDIVVHPRPAVQAILDEIIVNPTQVIGQLVGEPAGSRSTAPLPPAGPCVSN